MPSRSTKIFVSILIAICAGTAIFFLRSDGSVPKILTATRVAFLVTEMTTTPGRQQLALDELVKGGDNAIVHLYPYLSDRRALATSNVRFLNTQAVPIEKYNATIALTVDELTLRYLCWTSKACDFNFDAKDPANWAVQLRGLADKCRARHPKLETECRAILESR